ncbi:MAG: hypothetical protein KDK39_13830 [Leptospiraceae bacterium]|nr:hypothetical protein [Leptospiraceae bacterium]
MLWTVPIKTARQAIIALLLLVLTPLALSRLEAQAYVPPGYGSGSGTSSSFGLDMALQEYGDDIYITLTPLFELPVGGFKIGLQIPVDVLVYDEDGSTGQDPPALREGQYDNLDDMARFVIYIKYGEHLYFDPDDAFNWSMYYGKITDGYMGHKTLIYRYVNNYNEDVFRAGLMADINNNWGGIEHFSSDVYRKEVIGWRGYIRPWGVITGMRNLFFAQGDLPGLHQVALSHYERDFIAQSGVFYQEKIPDQGTRGRVGQHFLPRFRDVLKKERNTQFREVSDPVTGETHIEAVPVDTRSDEQKILENQKEADDDSGSIWEHGFWNRFAIGYSVVEDRDAPLSLEYDGSGNLVIDPDTLVPRGLDDETVTFTGYDAEFRLSPFRWLDFTPYADINRIEEIDGAEGTHVGIDFLFKLSGAFKVTVRPEYREYTSNYIPVYFDSYHAIERTVYNPGGDGDSTTGSGSNSVTKLAYLKSLPADEGITKGYFAQIIFEWVETIVLETTYEDYDGANNSVIFTGLYIPAVANLYFNGYYTKKNFDQVKESFEYDDRSLVSAELGYELFGGITLSVAFRRTWEYNDQSAAYEPVDETSYNVGYSSIF